MLLVRAFPRIPPISTFSSFRNWGKYNAMLFPTEDLKTKRMIWNLSVSHPPELQCWKTQPSCWVGLGTSQSGGKPFSPMDIWYMDKSMHGHMNASGSDVLGHLELPILGLFPLISEVGWQGYLVLLVLNIRWNPAERYQPQSTHPNPNSHLQ